VQGLPTRFVLRFVGPLSQTISSVGLTVFDCLRTTKNSTRQTGVRVFWGEQISRGSTHSQRLPQVTIEHLRPVRQAIGQVGLGIECTLQAA